MIYSYGFKNYFGFKDGAEVSFILNNRVPSDVSNGREVATILGVKGANGAGKTNLLKALAFIFEFSSNSFKKEKEDEVDADPYFDSKKPSEFYIDFKIGNYIYNYEISVKEDSVKYEKMSRKEIVDDLNSTKKRKEIVFERRENQIKKRLTELAEIDVIALKKNASVISSVNNYKFSRPLVIFEDLYRFFSRFISNVHYTGLYDFSSDSESILRISSFYHNTPEAFEFVKKIITSSDLGVNDIKIKDRLDERGEKIYYPIFYHSVGEKRHGLTIYDQSSGTKSLYVKLQRYWNVLTFGGVLILDEFDLNCHPLMLPKLLNLFESTEVNKKNAQFIFTSHITEVLEKLSKYRTYLVNKEDNECYCYRLDEIGGDLLRHGRPISPIYNDGKIGGVPKI